MFLKSFTSRQSTEGYLSLKGLSILATASPIIEKFRSTACLVKITQVPIKSYTSCKILYAADGFENILK